MRHQDELQKMTGVTIRRLGDADGPAVSRLVQLDSADVPEGQLLGAEIEGELVAVTPISGGKTVADPFSRTDELRALLELRAAQLRGRETPRRSFLGGLFARSRTPAPGPTAPAPPGAGGRLLSQPLRPY